MEQRIASILIKQYSENSNPTFTFEKHSTIYIYSEKSFQYLGMSRLWIETTRTTQQSRRINRCLHGIKRIRPIGEKTIEECFKCMNLSGIHVEIHDDEIYVDTMNIRKFIIRCFESFFTETLEYDVRKYGSELRRKPKCHYRNIF